HALRSAQRVVVFALESVLPDQTAEPDRGKSVRLALDLRDFADIADEMGDDRGIRIAPLGLRLNDQSRDHDAPLLECRDDAEWRIAEYQRGLIRRTPRALHDLRDFGAVDVRDRRDARERGAQTGLG